MEQHILDLKNEIVIKVPPFTLNPAEIQLIHSPIHASDYGKYIVGMINGMQIKMMYVDLGLSTVLDPSVVHQIVIEDSASLTAEAIEWILATAKVPSRLIKCIRAMQFTSVVVRKLRLLDAVYRLDLDHHCLWESVDHEVDHEYEMRRQTFCKEIGIDVDRDRFCLSMDQLRKCLFLECNPILMSVETISKSWNMRLQIDAVIASGPRMIGFAHVLYSHVLPHSQRRFVFPAQKAIDDF
jgi:hypothetical protein